jgi:hypothetical protein
VRYPQVNGSPKTVFTSREISTVTRMTARSLYANTDVQDLTGSTADGQSDWATADGAILDDRLLRRGGVDLQRKRFSAMRTPDLSCDCQFHRINNAG